MVLTIQPQLPPAVALAAAEAALFKPGQVLEALVLGKTPEGLVALKIGDIVLNAQLPTALPPGTRLQLSVTRGGATPQLALVGTPLVPAQAPPPMPVPPVAPMPVPRVEPQIVPPAGSGVSAAAPVAMPQPGPVVSGGAQPAAPVAVPEVQPLAAGVPRPNAESSQRAAAGGAPATSTVAATVSQAPGSPPAASSAPTLPTPTAASAPGVTAAAPPPPAPIPLTSPVTVSPVATVSSPAQPLPPVQAAVPSVAPGQVAPTSAGVSALAVTPQIEPPAPSPLLLAQGADRRQPTAAEMPRPTPPAPAGTSTARPVSLPATPAAALSQMIPEAMARQNSLAPLLASLAAVVAAPGALPEPVLRAALQVLAQRVQVPPAGPSARQLEVAVARSGIYLEAALAKGMPAADLKSGLVALRGAVATWFGGTPGPVTAVRQAAPPLRGMPPRAAAPDLPPLPDAPREVARALHSQTDGALSRVKLMQLASLPDADSVRPVAPEIRTELPLMIGHELVMAQFQVTRDGARREAQGKRGWTMRFAMRLAASGEVGAEIALLGRSVNVALWAEDPAMAADLEAALPELAPALAAIGLEPGAVRIRAMPPDPPRPASGQYLDSRT